MYLLDVPSPESALSDEHLATLLEWFRFKAEEEKADPYSLAVSFTAISEFLTLRSDQLGHFVDLVDGKLSFLQINLKFRPTLENRSIPVRRGTPV